MKKTAIIFFGIWFAISLGFLHNAFKQRKLFRQELTEYVAKNHPQYEVDFNASMPRDFVHPKSGIKYNSNEHLNVILSSSLKESYLKNSEVEAKFEGYQLLLWSAIVSAGLATLFYYWIFRNN